MRLNIPRLRGRMPSPRIWLGLALIGVSVFGTVWVVSENSTGTGMVLAFHPGRDRDFERRPHGGPRPGGY
jgi:hypothetical protein